MTLRGGKKHQYLLRNKQVIVDFMEKYGTAATLREFNVQPETLSRLLENETPSAELGPIARLDGRVDVVAAGLAEVRQRQADLEERFDSFSNEISNKITELAVRPILDSLGIRPNIEVDNLSQRKQKCEIKIEDRAIR